VLRPAHLHRRPQEERSGTLHCFLLDCSASMVSGGQLARAKGWLVALMDEAYRRRDHVALLCFSGANVTLRVPPRRAGAWNEAWVAPVAGGGGTPLAAAVLAGERLLARSGAGRRRQLWLLTDGRTRELPPRPASADAVHLVDFEAGAQPLHRAERVAAHWQAAYTRA
jgi:magnesium chelatase subunit ChlD-like protein